MREYTPAEAEAIAARMRRKAGRRDEWAATRAAKAVAAQDASHRAVEGIPFGQPILVGHHSQRRHERAVNTARAKLGQAVEHSTMRVEHERTAGAQRAWADEVERRASGPRYGRADLVAGDRVQLGKWVEVNAVVVRANAKSCTVVHVHDAEPGAAELRKVWEMFEDGNPSTVPWLKVRAAWRLVGGAWLEVEAKTEEHHE